MPAVKNYDIREIDWPISILNCKKEVDGMKAGERLCVLVKDIDVANNLIALLRNLTGIGIETEKTDSYYTLTINKYEAV